MRTIGWLLLAAFILTAPVSAATLIALDLPELVRGSEHIVVARTGARTPRKAGDTGLIVTDVQLRIVASLKGSAKSGDTLTATVLGGALGDIALTVPGEAAFPDDRSAIVFLRRNKLGELNVTGMSQGVMPITGEGKEARVTPGGAGAALVQPGTDGMLRDAPDALLHPQPLTDVLAEIRRLARP